tara:strand:+ start:540 stop:1829 length:1290 start_codon:yes stop_codon:yes gene_type:complete
MSITVNSSASNTITITASTPSTTTVLGKGVKGDKGDTGATGATGATGPAGADGTSPNAFTTIAVAGQDNVVADGTSDTLTIAGGSNVTVTTNASSDTVTIASTDTNTQLSTEEVQDIVGAMFTGNTETRIAATYEDSDGTIDLVVDAIPVDLTSDGAGTIHANNVPTLNQNTSGTAAGLSSTLAVSSGGTGATTLTDNAVLTGTGTSAITAEANLTFSSDTLTIGAASEITPTISLVNDENTAVIAIADSTNNLLFGVSDGDLLIESEGDHSVVIGQNDTIHIKVTAKGAEINKRHFQVTSNIDGDHDGDVVYLGSTTSMTRGALYHFKSDGTWELADANAVSTCDGLLGIALGTSSDSNGVLLRGMVTIDHDPGAVGDVLFVSTTPGDITSTPPSGNQDVVRVVGYCLDASNGQIWFNPDGTFVEVSA